MISFLRGKVIFKGESFLIIETQGGTAYKVFIGKEAAANFESRDKNKEIEIWTHLYQREDTIELYGFQNYAELEFFETLIKVPGIGPKSGMAVFEVASVDVLKNAIASGQTQYLTRVSGIGRKTAEKIVLELRDKFGAKAGAVFQFKEDEEVFEALKSLGYSPRDIRETLSKIPKEKTGVQNRLKEALKILGGQSPVISQN